MRGTGSMVVKGAEETHQMGRWAKGKSCRYLMDFVFAIVAPVSQRASRSFVVVSPL
jgi:hypothetical protein